MSDMRRRLLARRAFDLARDAGHLALRAGAIDLVDRLGDPEALRVPARLRAAEPVARS
jgi:hypothetical protein